MAAQVRPQPQFACHRRQRSITITASPDFPFPEDAAANVWRPGGPSLAFRSETFPVMAETLVCPKCKHGFRLPAQHVGAKIPCPRCEYLVAAAVRPEDITVDRPTAGPQSRQRREVEDDPDEDLPPRRQQGFKPCPRCGAEGARRVLWTPWGSFYGPALFSHVRCPECRCGYNGRTGGSNLIPAIVFVTIPSLMIAGLLAFMAWVIYKAIT